MNRAEKLNALVARLETLGRAVFGASLDYRVTVPAEDTSVDATVVLDGTVSISVYEPYDAVPGAPDYYWGTVSSTPGTRWDPLDEDFNEMGSCTGSGYHLDRMLKAVFDAVVELRWKRQLDAEVDVAAAEAGL